MWWLSRCGVSLPDTHGRIIARQLRMQAAAGQRLREGCQPSNETKRKTSVATLLIDDQRNLPADRIVRTYRECIAALAEQHWGVLYLDHDLGDFSGAGGRELTGYDIACWLEQHRSIFRIESRLSPTIQ